MFRVTTLDMDNVAKIPRAKNEEGKELPGVDYASDFFGKAAFLVRFVIVVVAILVMFANCSFFVGGDTSFEHAHTDGFGPAWRRNPRLRLGRCVHVWPYLPRGEFADGTPSCRILDGRAGDGIRRPNIRNE